MGIFYGYIDALCGDPGIEIAVSGLIANKNVQRPAAELATGGCTSHFRNERRRRCRHLEKGEGLGKIYGYANTKGFKLIGFTNGELDFWNQHLHIKGNAGRRRDIVGDIYTAADIKRIANIGLEVEI